MATRAFISYSHHDSSALERLHVHLAALRRDGLIDAWFDRDILAGAELNPEIKRELEAASLFLLLVSPDFIASNYCMDVEMKRALERHEAGEARVVPIIVEPCDWASVKPLRRLKALPRDGQPVSDWANPNTAYLNIVQELRRIIEAEQSKPREAMPEAAAPSAIKVASGSRYRVQKDFDEIDRIEYRDAAFASIRDYFRRATAELDTIDGLRGRFVERGANSFGATVINQGRSRGVAHITVHCRSGRRSIGDITYAFNENASEDTYNGALSVSSDEYEQFIKGSDFHFNNRDMSRMSPDQAAEQLWNQFIEQAGISYA